MQQFDLYEQTVISKLARLEKWMSRIQKQMAAAQDDLYLLKTGHPPRPRIKRAQDHSKITQIDMFGT
jgi:hypothetical protein